jgi:hypothetical protein
MVIVSAGRRVDAAGATEPRFPAANVVGVRERIRARLYERKPSDVVCAAACGADLLLLDVAGEMRLRRHVILPGSRTTFRGSSVADRPGGWEILFDRIIDEVEASRNLRSMSVAPGQEGYLAANIELLATAGTLAANLNTGVQALVIWNGASRGATDVTEHFIQSARARGYEIVEVSTLL